MGQGHYIVVSQQVVVGIHASGAVSWQFCYVAYYSWLDDSEDY